ncbi:vacuolar membrane protein [Sistotremastrum suecicum HHB10207 ss-3]|uniref:Vacuolar membrane protein n=1 Tax=Sistotremastrum suecicum HHB10207 ss-3 TaxID=1314776 RepID=A0A166G7W6_9AGAM|nr:vacuolar membrane protein [Sistotremastrum suecicum HHB10207 ss-3]
MQPKEIAWHRRDYWIGIGLLLIVVLLWTSSNFVTQDVYADGFKKPFLVTYISTSAFMVYLTPHFIRKWYRRNQSPDTSREQSESEALLPEQSSLHLPPLSDRETAELALVFCIFWFVANWSLNAALGWTSVASSTILSSMSGFFTLGIGRLFRVESFTLLKVAAVITSFCGVVLVSISDHDSTSGTEPPSLSGGRDPTWRPLLGDFLAILSALFYALYVTLLKVRIRSESRIDMQLFFGFVGLFNVLTCWPIGLILHFTGVETLEMPPTGRVWTGIVANMFITLSSDYLYVLSMLKTTPLVVTVGLSLTIPCAVIGDFFLAVPTSTQAIIGACFVVVSFVVLGMDRAPDVRKRDTLEDVAGHLGNAEQDQEGSIHSISEAPVGPSEARPSAVSVAPAPTVCDGAA